MSCQETSANYMKVRFNSIENVSTYFGSFIWILSMVSLHTLKQRKQKKSCHKKPNENVPNT